MNETYVECLVKRKTPAYATLLKILTIMLAVCFILVGLIIWPALIIGVVIGIIAYFVSMNADIEYEYLYVDKELTIDKVMAKSKRKRVIVLDMERLEILAPVYSYHLDNYKNRTTKAVDYSTGEVKQPDTRYALFYNGDKKYIIEPTPELVNALKMIAPRKVFTD